MSLEQVISSLPFVGKAKQYPQHPLGPLTASEITESAELIRSAWPSHTDCQFKAITLEEPKKSEAAPYLDAVRAGEKGRTIDRRSFVVYYLRNTVRAYSIRRKVLPCGGVPRLTSLVQDKLHEAVVNLSTGKVESNVRLGANVHGSADGEEIVLAEKICLEDEGVQAEIAKLQLPEGTVVISDPWIYGWCR